ANLARFSKQDHPRDGYNAQRKDAGGYSRFNLLLGKRKQKATFTDVVRWLAQRKQDKENQARRLEQSLRLCNLVINSRMSDSEWLKGSFTRVLKSSCLLSSIQDRMVCEAIPLCEIRPLGGRLVLMIASGESNMANIVANNHEKLSLWFDAVRPWKKEDIGGSRLASIRCSGIPLHVWMVEFFEQLVK
ncbi:hypothetical protein Ancab_023147, partial [Ancistrocladus abbreviatus]